LGFRKDSYDPMKMIRHDDIFIDFNMIILREYPFPAIIDDFTAFLMHIKSDGDHTI